ncbi:MAG: thrombospondin type 3 repeat-containing protein, partial [Desulfobulbaceae bacterium]|nr:thrombospondin type 3 repeat-containing protein [Desulfobulbaceae bacterium]
MELKKLTHAIVIILLATMCFTNHALSGCLPGTLGDEGDTEAASSVDPNALTGPAGYGENHYVPADTLIAYRIDFENDSTASAPAQQVDITNQLEEGLDWTSFRLTEIGFGDQFIPVPPGNQQFQTTLPMTYNDVIFEVWINAGIDVNTGKVYAHFYSIDPETGWPPPVDIGFLPPEDGTGRGMGHIGYTINHVEELEENSEIRNIALIVFDLGEEIYTNQIDPHDPSQGTDPELEAPITIDRGIPISTMGSMPEESPTSTFIVSWGGSDSASGVAAYNIYTRDSQEVNWQLWLERTTATSAEFMGIPGHIHEFYSIAIDNVGHFEQKLPAPAAKTFVNPTAVNDLDNDGIIDSDDNCPSTSNADQTDSDGDGLGDICDEDDDGDGVADTNDNCPLTVNTDQADLDADGLGDICDEDDDGDGVADTYDNCPLTANGDQADSDGDGIGNICDDDDDG